MRNPLPSPFSSMGLPSLGYRVNLLNTYTQDMAGTQPPPARFSGRGLEPVRYVGITVSSYLRRDLRLWTLEPSALAMATLICVAHRSSAAFFSVAYVERL